MKNQGSHPPIDGPTRGRKRFPRTNQKAGNDFHGPIRRLEIISTDLSEGWKRFPRTNQKASKISTDQSEGWKQTTSIRRQELNGGKARESPAEPEDRRTSSLICLVATFPLIFPPCQENWKLYWGSRNWLRTLSRLQKARNSLLGLICAGVVFRHLFCDGIVQG